MGIFSNIFGQKKLSEPLDISAIKVDMHSHLLPGIDDGVPDLQTSISIIKKLKEFGYQKIITTPHIMSDIYKNTPEIIISAANKVREAIANEGINIEFEAAAEYQIDDSFREHMLKNDLLTLKDKYILVELPYFSVPPGLNEIIFDLQINNYKIVLAHPERYVYWHHDFSKFEDLKYRDILFQINIISLTGTYSAQTKKLAEKFIDLDMVDFVGTDVHYPQHIKLLEKSLYLPSFEKLLKSGHLKNHLLL